MWEVKGKVLDEKNKEHIYIGMKKGNQNYRNYRISSCLIPNSKATHYFHLKPKHKVYFIRIFPELIQQHSYMGIMHIYFGCLKL